MKVFVTGGTGTVGDLLVANLLDANHDVTVITRNISKVTNSWKDNVNLVEGDVTDSGSWVSSLDGQDAIINLAGENIFGKRWTEKQKERIYDSRVETTKNLVNHVKSLDNPPSVFVSVSGADYYPISEEKVFTEEDDPADTFLGKLCSDWEAPVKSLDEKIRSVIFRMGVGFGYTGDSAERMFLPHKFFVGGWIGSGSQKYAWVHIRDFVGMLQWAIENDHVNGVYNGVADSQPMKELATIGGKIMGRWTWTWAPAFILRLVLGERAKLILKGRAVSGSKVRKAGYQFKFPTAKEAFEDILEDF